MLWEVVESALDEARQFLLFDLIETYFPLTDKQRARYQRLVSRKENWKMQEVELSWAEKLEQKGLEKGREQGREEGLLAGKRETLTRLMTAKFGALPDAETEYIEAIESLGELDALLERVLTATSLDEMKL